MNNRFIYLIAIAVLFLFIFGVPKLIDKICDRVIVKLQKEYSPGPYSPGFDPDKISPNSWR